MRVISTAEIAVIVDELQELAESHIERFYEIGENRFRLKLSKNRVQTNLQIILSHAINKTEYIEKQEQPSNFTVAVRKRIEGFLIKKILQLNNDRIVLFVLEKGDEQINLIVEMFGKGNLIIADRNMKILLAYRSQEFKDRIIKIGMDYKPPTQTLSYKVERHATIAPTIYRDEAGKAIDYSLIENEKYKGMKSQHFETFQETLDAFYYENPVGEDAGINAEQKKIVEELQNSIKKQQKILQGIEKEIEENKNSGKQIFENMKIPVLARSGAGSAQKSQFYHGHQSSMFILLSFKSTFNTFILGNIFCNASFVILLSACAAFISSFIIFMLSKIKAIFITHTHGDHIIGLAGLVRTMALNRRLEPLNIYVPAGEEGKITTLLTFDKAIIGFKTIVKGIKPGLVQSGEGFKVTAFKLDHTIPTLGYIFEQEGKTRFLKEKCKKLGLKGTMFSQLAKRGSIKVNGKTIRLKDVSYVVKSVKVAYATDTRPTESTVKVAAGVDLLIHEACFADKLRELAKERSHSTSAEAAHIAKRAKCNRLVLFHMSARYKDTNELLKEARKVFKNTDVAKDGMVIDL